MPAAVAIPLIMGAASVGGQVVSAKMQSNAAKNAAKTQSDAANVAMANTRQDTDRALSYIDQMRGNIRPPGQQQGGAYGSLSHLLGLGGGSAPAMGSGSPMAYGTGGSAPGMAMFGSGNPQTVRMRAPSGEVADVPMHRAEYFEQKGARRLQ